MLPSNQSHLLARVLRTFVVLVCSLGGTCVLFLVLPVIQAMTGQPMPDRTIRSMDAVSLPTPEDTPEPEPEPEPEEDEVEPELQEDMQALDLSQLDLALNSGMSGGWADGNFGMKIETLLAGAAKGGAATSLLDLDQKPVVTRRVSPRFTAAALKHAPGKVWFRFIVNEDGLVEDPRVESATHDVFVAPALAAIRRWKFEPGRSKGKPVRSPMKLPISIPASKKR